MAKIVDEKGTIVGLLLVQRLIEPLFLGER
jgi:hypothetical protein